MNQEVFEILVVDDDEHVLKSLVRFLRSEGFSVIQASDPLQALELLKTNGVSLILTDIDMPNLSGLEFAKKVKEKHNDNFLQIVYMSGDVAHEASIPSDSFFIQKPFDIKCLLEGLRSVLSIQNYLSGKYKEKTILHRKG